jgi:hypothetical protein
LCCALFTEGPRFCSRCPWGAPCRSVSSGIHTAKRSRTQGRHASSPVAL